MLCVALDKRVVCLLYKTIDSLLMIVFEQDFYDNQLDIEVCYPFMSIHVNTTQSSVSITSLLQVSNGDKPFCLSPCNQNNIYQKTTIFCALFPTLKK